MTAGASSTRWRSILCAGVLDCRRYMPFCRKSPKSVFRTSGNATGTGSGSGRFYQWTSGSTSKNSTKKSLMTKRLKTVYRSELTCPHINLTTYKTSLCNQNFMQNEYLVKIVTLWPGQIKIKFDKSRLFAWNSSKNHLYDLLFRFRTPLLPPVRDQNHLKRLKNC